MTAVSCVCLVYYKPTCRRQEELEARLVEEETTKRVEELVAKRVQEELERRKDEIEAEVLRRVEEAKKVGAAELTPHWLYGLCHCLVGRGKAD